MTCSQNKSSTGFTAVTGWDPVKFLPYILLSYLTSSSSGYWLGNSGLCEASGDCASLRYLIQVQMCLMKSIPFLFLKAVECLSENGFVPSRQH